MATWSGKAASPGKELGENDLKYLYDALYPVRNKCRALGLQLGLVMRDIKAIEQTDPGERLLEMLSVRLDKAEPLTWDDVDTALRSNSVGESKIADSIRREYGHFFSPDTSTPHQKYKEYIDKEDETKTGNGSRDERSLQQGRSMDGQEEDSDEEVGRREQITKDSQKPESDEESSHLSSERKEVTLRAKKVRDNLEKSSACYSTAYKRVIPKERKGKSKKGKYVKPKSEQFKIDEVRGRKAAKKAKERRGRDEMAKYKAESGEEREEKSQKRREKVRASIQGLSKMPTHKRKEVKSESESESEYSSESFSQPKPKKLEVYEGRFQQEGKTVNSKKKAKGRTEGDKIARKTSEADVGKKVRQQKRKDIPKKDKERAKPREVSKMPTCKIKQESESESESECSSANLSQPIFKGDEGKVQREGKATKRNKKENEKTGRVEIASKTFETHVGRKGKKKEKGEIPQKEKQKAATREVSKKSTHKQTEMESQSESECECSSSSFTQPIFKELELSEGKAAKRNKKEKSGVHSKSSEKCLQGKEKEAAAQPSGYDIPSSGSTQEDSEDEESDSDDSSEDEEDRDSEQKSSNEEEETEPDDESSPDTSEEEVKIKSIVLDTKRTKDTGAKRVKIAADVQDLPGNEDQSDPGGRDQEEHDIQPKKRSRRRHREISISPTTRGSSSPSTSQEENQKQVDSKEQRGKNKKGRDHKKKGKLKTKEEKGDTSDSSPECDRSSESEKLRIKIFEHFYGRLCCEISNPVETAAQLQMKGLISKPVMKEMIKSPESQQVKTINLVDELDKIIKSKPDCLFTFIQVLLENEALQKVGSEILTEAGK